jgi:dephospho-CoA kinase
MTLVIGLTGSIASGKSTISSMFKELQIPVIDADKIARDVVEPGEEAYDEIVKEFGKSILLENQSIDRKKLGSIIFTNEEKRGKLNSIVHPAIRKRMLAEKEAYIKARYKCVVMDIPLLFESKLTHFVEKILVVYVDEHIQLKRLISRDGSSEEEALQRICSQIPVREKIELADAVINNNGTIDESFEQLKDVLTKWDVLAKHKDNSIG